MKKVPVFYILGGRFKRYNGKALCQLMFSSGGYACLLWLARAGPDFLRYRAQELIRIGESDSLQTVLKCGCGNSVKYLIRHDVGEGINSSRHYFYNEWYCSDCLPALSEGQKIMPVRFSSICSGNNEEQRQYKQMLRTLCCHQEEDVLGALYFFFDNKAVANCGPWCSPPEKDLLS